MMVVWFYRLSMDDADVNSFFFIDDEESVRRVFGVCVSFCLSF